MAGAEILTPWVVGPVRTVLIIGVAIIASFAVKRPSRYSEWPVFSCPLMAGFGCPPRASRRACDARRSANPAAASPPGRPMPHDVRDRDMPPTPPRRELLVP